MTRTRNNTDAVVALGFTYNEAASLRRIAQTLHGWHEHECNGAIQRDGDDNEGKPFWYSTVTGKRIMPAIDRERGALVRLGTIMKHHPTLTPYVQTDPRGHALFILRPGDVPEGKDPAAYYTRGVAVY